ncbi:uncharacterized protein TRIADDRAFT_55092 [Trichoplax adhaerens]|uniref:tRNA wybutosine-synthesizing protein 4 n=1 Tax=Trichoplax adhaerens TaxID=10228 RepID=B3RQR9_TRIAD|nr:hypothetical protein TRIADDRAFT_55092 [Trichoplax adhaerens]EDV26751.1 hypothetical protein TRIADDRAFT_55092 [Trichoplax adhaerens]|eukprot:XP_002110747.1 hypothetical protein TRIADDRAFT_55092 [Trichoplax adhaerens]
MKKTKKSRSDTAVQGTNDNSIVSKLSSAKHGYYQDDFLQYVVQKPARRSPLINRGYYIRAKAIDFVIRKFLSYSNNDEAANKNKQILSLGAGFDTLYYRYHSLNMLDSTIVYETLSVATLFEKIVTNIVSSSCHSSSNIIGWASKFFSNAMFVTYEQIQPNDAFGRVMIASVSSNPRSMFIAVTGGFGLLSDSRHRRLSDISVFHITNDPKKEITLVNSTELDNPRLFHAVIPISDNKIAIFGGRLSPLKHYGDVIVVTFNLEPIHTDESTTEGDSAKTPTSSQLKHKVDIGWESIACSGDMPTARWRHTATIIDDGKCLIFGGITTNMVTLNDSYIFEFASRKWSRVSVAGLVSPRHSHTACKWKDYVVVYGGLGFDFKPAIGISALNIKDELAMNWISLEFNPQLPTRYSHTAHVLEDRLLVIGGIDPFLTCTNTLIDINLENRTWRMFLLQEPCIEKPILMLHNHDSVCLGKSRQQVFTLGGGGNCFSFGTHFNSHLLEIVLPT